MGTNSPACMHACICICICIRIYLYFYLFYMPMPSPNVLKDLAGEEGKNKENQREKEAKDEDLNFLRKLKIHK